MRRRQAISAILLMLGLMPNASFGQNPAGQNPAGATAAEPPPSVINKTVEAGDDEDPRPPGKTTRWNEHDGRISTLKFGYTFLLDFAARNQDEANKKQVKMNSSDVGIRDVRLLLSGRFKTKRPVSW